MCELSKISTNQELKIFQEIDKLRLRGRKYTEAVEQCKNLKCQLETAKKMELMQKEK